MKISAEIILASKNAATGDTLVTLRLTYPRIILAEVLTHRALSRNTSSTRAIPGRKLRQAVLHEPFIPQFIGQNRKGMQAGQELSGWRRKAAESVFRYGRYIAVFENWLLEKLGVHKQTSGRVLENWMWVTQVVTATDWKNFLLLRNHKDAEPHFRELARQIQFQLSRASAGIGVCGRYGLDSFHDEFQYLRPGQWHIPFLGPDEQSLTPDQKLKVSAARAARTSYTVSGSSISEWEADFRLADKLITDKHYSPLEHQAQAANDFRYYGNFKSFIQYRKTMLDEEGGDRAPQDKHYDK